jgi:hypothetical protein
MIEDATGGIISLATKKASMPTQESLDNIKGEIDKSTKRQH